MEGSDHHMSDTGLSEARAPNQGAPAQAASANPQLEAEQATPLEPELHAADGRDASVRVEETRQVEMGKPMSLYLPHQWQDHHEECQSA